MPFGPVKTVEIHGYALRAIRIARGRDRAGLAEAVGVGRPYITRLELGHSTRVSEVLYSRLLSELGIDDRRALLATAPSREDVA
jgi:transcriptional regulator with XRE-family HTH domain